ncbi:hypothetical protein PHLCEN_2v9569 [Hermanssonia centrifuga]|uniref:Uncharacterized protein n=1 Tax=Hermanssonia centrifuga TaxID=98765 RepID=A0A2R6NQD7_9APHY|nr:hypothetical protein PHLCEN_2v9569 [Hermanssonia centrifuga]
MNLWDFSDPPNNEAQDTPENPGLFLFNGRLYRCKTCPNARWQSLKKAAMHEDVNAHVMHVRDLDGRAMHSDPLGPNMDDKNCFNSTPSTPVQLRTDPQPRSPLPPSSPFSDYTAGIPHDATHSDSDKLEDAADEIYVQQQARNVALDTTTVHGPALANDPPHQIYDNWGGFMVYEKTRSPAELEDQDDELDQDGLPSDGIEDAVLTFASSDPLAIEPITYDEFAEQAPSDGIGLSDDEAWYPWSSKKEVSNPIVRPSLHFYPEDSHQRLAEAWQGERWRTEVESTFSGIMTRANDGQDYFVDEPALANTDGLGRIQPVLPIRFFMRDNNMFAKVLRLHIARRDESASDVFVVDARSEDDSFELPVSRLFLSYPRFLEAHKSYGLPSPTTLSGISRNIPGAPIPASHIEPWSVPLPNPWRIKANGRRVLGLPLWCYCDDTSGNSSKKWNKHNSFLCVLGGLPREQVHLAYNIHFLATSNIAAPLEMLEGIVADLQHMQEHGLAAWDCIFEEDVLYIPWLLACLGNNPMQSELSSHIGMQGKFSCRVCHAGKDTKSGEHHRLSTFLQAGAPRTHDETLEALQTQWAAVKAGAPSRVDGLATESGIKDKHFTSFVERFSIEIAKHKAHNRAAGKPATDGIHDLVDKVLDGKDDNFLFNPLFYVKGIDPHADTPVEILHVVLLGFVKYFWRDAVSRQNAAGKKTLKTRLASLNVADLDLPALQANTLVQYAKSLTGRDFRVVAQVAPAVLYDLIPPAAYEAWLALSRLVPLVFQPSIEDIDNYLKRLEDTIDDFLAATALWSVQWFNKPKFHLLVHILQHIRRFGPAILMATEGFESFNFVIRLRSILSNRHAPSVDIAAAMSFMHAVRHLVSGGFIYSQEDSQEDSRRQSGPEVQCLLNDAVFLKFMGMTNLQSKNMMGRVTFLRGQASIAWRNTQAIAKGYRIPMTELDDLVDNCASVKLENGDTARLKGFVLFEGSPQAQASQSNTRLGRIAEIIQKEDGLVLVLITKWEILARVLPYRMPSVRATRCHVVVAVQLTRSTTALEISAQAHCPVWFVRSGMIQIAGKMNISILESRMIES